MACLVILQKPTLAFSPTSLDSGKQKQKTKRKKNITTNKQIIDK